MTPAPTDRGTSPAPTNRLARTLADLRRRDRRALIPYVMAGDPDPTATQRLVEILTEAGADAVELGVPFSDPIADGVIVGSALVQMIEEAPDALDRVGAFVRDLRSAIDDHPR